MAAGQLYIEARGRSERRIAHRHVRDFAICATCGAEELAALDRIESCRSSSHCSHGGTFIGTVEEVPFVGSVVTGFASLKRVMADGRRQMVSLLFPGETLSDAPTAPSPQQVSRCRGLFKKLDQR